MVRLCRGRRLVALTGVAGLVLCASPPADPPGPPAESALKRHSADVFRFQRVSVCVNRKSYNVLIVVRRFGPVTPSPLSVTQRRQFALQRFPP